MHSTDPACSAAEPTTGRASTFVDRLAGHRGLATWALILSLPLIAVSTGRIFHNDDQRESGPIADFESIAWPRGVPQQSAPRQTTASPTSAAPVESLVEGLERRLASEPGDAKGWALLAQSYAFLDDAERADSAMAKAIALGLDANDLRHRVSLAFSGQGATDTLAAASMPGVIQGVVTLADGIDIELPRESRLFVTAKATDGSTMPIAVLGSRVTEFPYRFTLSNDNAMLPGVTLADFDEIAVSARISASGTAARSADDLESAVGVVRVAAPGSVLLVLERR